MALTYNESTGKYTDSFTITKGSGNVLSLATSKKYLPGNIEFTINATTVNPTFSSPTPTGGATATAGSMTISTSSGDSKGITLQTKYTVNTVSFTYNNNFSGWIDKTSGASAGKTSARSSTNGTLYYVTALTVPSDKTFPVTATGTVNVTASSNSAGTINVVAYPSSGTTAEGSKTIVSAGKWNEQTISAADTWYYGKVKASALTLPTGTATSSSGTSKATITPGTSNKYINIPTGYLASAGYYTISGDANLTAANIKTGTTVFGIAGTFTQDGTAAASHILNGKIAYVNGSKVTGNIANLAASNITMDGLTVSVAASKYTTGSAITKEFTQINVPSGKTLSLNNTGTVSVTSGTTTAGTVNIVAYPASGSTIESSQAVVKGGRWVTTSVTTSGTYYGKVSISAGSATTPATTVTSQPSVSIDSDGLITASNSKTQNVTPTISAGYVSSGTAGTITVNGSSTLQLTKRTSSNVTLSGVTVTAASGYYPSNGTLTLSSITVPKATALTVTMTANTAADNKVLTVTNNAYRTTNITSAGTVNFTSATTPAGTLSVTAYPASGTTADASKTIVSGGRWVCTPDFSGAGTYYGKVIVGSASATLGGSTSTTGTIAAAIGNTNSMATISDLSGKTAGTHYWQVKATASVTQTPKFTPKLTLSTAGWMASAPTGSATNVSVNGDSTGQSLYIPRATFTTNSADVVKYTTDGSNAGVNIASIVGTASASEPTSGVYVAFTGSGNAKVATAGYIPKDATTETTSTVKYFPITQATVTQGNASITSISYTYNSTNGNFTVSGSANTGALTVNTAGYISSSHGTKNAGTASLSNVTVAKIAGTASITTTTVTPVISKQNVPSGVTQAASGTATTAAPSSGVYVAVQSAAKTTTATPSVSISTNGYGTNAQHSISGSAGTVGAGASAMTYIPITTSSVKVGGGALTSKGSSATLTNASGAATDASGGVGIKIATHGTAGRAKITYAQATNGWVTLSNGADANGGAAIAASSWDGDVIYLTGVELKAPTTSGKTNDFNITVPNGANSTVTFKFSVDTSGNVTITDS